MTAPTAVTKEFFSRWFDELEPGLIYRSPSHLITAEDVAQFADLTGDHHPQHVDPEYAARGPFGGLAAHGMFVVSLAMGLMPVEPGRTLALRRISDVTFKRPALVGQSILIETRITGLSPGGPTIGLVTVHVKMLVHSESSGERPRLAARGSIEAVWARDPSVHRYTEEDAWSQLAR